MDTGTEQISTTRAGSSPLIKSYGSTGTMKRTARKTGYRLLFDDIELSVEFYTCKYDADQAAEYERFMYGGVVEVVEV